MTGERQISLIEEISSRKYGNPLIAGGAFGQVSIAIQISPSSSLSPAASLHFLDDDLPRFVAVKRIRNALTYTNTNDNGNDKDDSESIAAYANIETLSPSWNLATASSSISMTEPTATTFQSQSQSQFMNIHQDSNQTTKHDNRKYQLRPPVFHEVAALRALGTNHPNITPLLSTFISSHDSITSLSLSFPYCPNDLSTVIAYRRRKHQVLTTAHIKAILKDTLSGIAHCHTMGILHCDIKPSNLLLTSNGTIQLADFGLARLAEPPSGQQPQNDHGIGTLHYRPPEILYGSIDYGPAVDVWGCGLVLAESCNFGPLFPGRNVLDQLGRVFAILGVPDGDSWDGIECLPDYGKVQFVSKAGCGDADGLVGAVPRIGECALLRELMTAMLMLDPKKRRGAGLCLEHSWFFRRPLASGSPLIAKELIPEELAVPNVTEFNILNEEHLNGLKRRGVCLAVAQRKARAGLFGDDGIEKKSVRGHTQGVGSSGILHMLASQMKT